MYQIYMQGEKSLEEMLAPKKFEYAFLVCQLKWPDKSNPSYDTYVRF